MASNNFEEQLQRKLNQRAIAPTGNAWERIAYNRQIQVKKKRKAIIYWVAAAAIIAFGSFSLLFRQQTILPENNVVVKEIPVAPQVLPQIEKEIPTAIVSSEAIVKPMKPETTETVTVTGIIHSDPWKLHLNLKKSKKSSRNSKPWYNPAKRLMKMMLMPYSEKRKKISHSNAPIKNNWQPTVPSF
ncbi:hypothetical protein [Flavobacterium sp. 3HN19-14]|uniref:hypothetical protein n=1 Tax=Flavobacterium sp. 3HN19-14 TaxID=3448133 RepID=UPI003EE10AA6